MPLVRDWHATVPRDYFAAGPGKSTEDVVGRVLLATEHLDKTKEAACFILDIDKCNENVEHSRIQAAAIRHSFPLTVARACISMYRNRRTVAWDGVFGQLVQTEQTLAAGCSIALWLLQLVMITALDEFADSIPPQVRLPEVYVDDATVVVVGDVGTVANLTTRAAFSLVHAFEEGCGLPVSRTKGQVTASNSSLSHLIAKKLRGLGCESVRAMKVLGIDTAAGKGGLRQTQRIRLSAFGKKLRRLGRLGQYKTAGNEFANVVRASGPLVTHGSRVIGMQPSVLERMRRLLAMALPIKSRSASLTLKYLTFKNFRLEPSFEACQGPLMFWCRLAWSYRNDRSVVFEMQNAWRTQLIRLSKLQRPWGSVAGPAGAVVLTLRRLGWIASSAFSWQTDDGVEVLIREMAPMSIRKLIDSSVQRCLWREWANSRTAKDELFIRNPGGYWMEEVRRWTGHASGWMDWTRFEASVVGSIVSGSQWPQDRLFLAGMVDVRECQACGSRQHGTVGHRLYQCRTLHDLRG